MEKYFGLSFMTIEPIIYIIGTQIIMMKQINADLFSGKDYDYVVRYKKKNYLYELSANITPFQT